MPAFNIKRLHNSWHNLVIYDAALLTELVVFNIRICLNINLAGPAGFVSIPLFARPPPIWNIGVARRNYASAKDKYNNKATRTYHRFSRFL